MYGRAEGGICTTCATSVLACNMSLAKWQCLYYAVCQGNFYNFYQGRAMPPQNLFFEQPILNSPYECPAQHWELDSDGQPTQKILPFRRMADFITPIPKPKRRGAKQGSLLEDAQAVGISTPEQEYHKALINEVRHHVAEWRKLPSAQWRVTPETARLLTHWRHHAFSSTRPFFVRWKR